MSKTIRSLGGIALASVLALSAAFSFVGCNRSRNSGSVDDEGNVHLVFAGRSIDSEEANYEVFINDFMDDHPNYTVEIRWWPNESSYMLALAGMGTDLPDLFMLGNGSFVSYAEAGLLADYKEFVDVEELTDTIYEYAAEAYCYNPVKDTFGWDETDPDCGFYGYPKDQGPYALMYNESLFRQLMDEYNTGKPSSQQITLPSATDPYTYDEFIDVNLKLKEVYSTLYQKDFYPVADYDLDSAVYSNNAHYFDETATTQKIDQDNFIRAIEFKQSLFSRGLIAPDGGTVASGETAFLNGNALFYYAGPWKMKDYWTQIDNFTWNLAPVCVGPAEGAVSTAYMGTMGYCISQNSQIKEYAAVLAKYLATNVDSQRTQYRRGQAIPNLIELSDEFCNDTLGLLANGTHAMPSNRSVWIDVVDGHGAVKTDGEGNEYTDKVAGKYQAIYYTYSTAWRTDLNSWFAGQGSNGKSVWKGQITARESCFAYAPLLQAALDDMKAQTA